MKYKLDKKRPLSWSQISCFEWDKNLWFSRYILKEKQESSSAMEFGKAIGVSLAGNPDFMPEVPRLPIFEYKLEAVVSGIPLIGFIDALDLDTKQLIEFKTGKSWTKKKADTHGQLDLYIAMLYIMHKIKPEEFDIRLIWLETVETGNFATEFVPNMKPVIFKVKKTMLDVVNILAKVKRIRKEMEEYLKTL